MGAILLHVEPLLQENLELPVVLGLRRLPLLGGVRLLAMVRRLAEHVGRAVGGIVEALQAICLSLRRVAVGRAEERQVRRPAEYAGLVVCGVVEALQAICLSRRRIPEVIGWRASPLLDRVRRAEDRQARACCGAEERQAHARKLEGHSIAAALPTGGTFFALILSKGRRQGPERLVRNAPPPARVVGLPRELLLGAGRVVGADGAGGAC